MILLVAVIEMTIGKMIFNAVPKYVLVRIEMLDILTGKKACSRHVDGVTKSSCRN